MRIEPLAAVRMSKGELTVFVNTLVALIASERKLLLNQDEQDKLAVDVVNEIIGLGPIEPLLNDPTVSNILINGAYMIYAERRGKWHPQSAEKCNHNTAVKPGGRRSPETANAAPVNNWG